MARKSPLGFRAVFEQLEGRDLMTADLSDLYRNTHLDLSATGSSGVATVSAVATTISSLYDSLHGTATIAAPTVLPSSSPTLGAANTVALPPASSAAVFTPAQPDWFDLNISDATLRTLVRQNVSTDHNVTRADMLGFFSEVEQDGKVSANELSDLRNIVGNTTYFVGLGLNYVRVLGSDVVNGNVANAHYQGAALGNLAAGASSSQLVKLVNKWFLGQDRPTLTAGMGLTYQTAAGSLFPHAPTYADVHQGIIGDCYFLSSLGEISLVNPTAIANMFIANGDGTYTVRFYHDNVPEFVTVDSQLPANSAGTYLYANLGQNIHSAGAPLWVALAEKAYAQMNESGWLRSDLGDKGHNTYDALNGGYMFDALAQVTGLRTGYSGIDQNKFATLLNAGKMITFGSNDTPADHTVVADHAYALLSYDARTQTVTLFNPWGLNNGAAPGTVTLTWTQLKKDFGDMEFTA